MCRSILHLRTIYRSIIDENLTGLQISDNKRATGFRSHCFFVCISASAVNLLKDASILKNLALPPKNTFNQNRLIKFNWIILNHFFMLIANVSLNFSNRNNMLRYFPLLQQVDEYLVALKDFDYSCSLGYKWPNMPKSRQNECFQRPKIPCFVFSFHLLSRKNMDSKSFFALIIEGIDTLWVVTL